MQNIMRLGQEKNPSSPTNPRRGEGDRAASNEGNVGIAAQSNTDTSTSRTNQASALPALSYMMSDPSRREAFVAALSEIVAWIEMDDTLSEMNFRTPERSRT